VADPANEGTQSFLERGARALRAGDLAELEALLRRAPEQLEARDAEGHTLLGLACKIATGDVALPSVSGTPEQHAAVDRILAAGANPSACAKDGWSPLHTAAMSGHVDLAKRLLAAGATREGHLLATEGGSPLSLALFYAQTQVAEILATPAVPDNLRSAAALDRSIDRFVDGGELTASAAEGTDFYRPSSLFPSWERTNARQELLDEALSWAARNDARGAMAALVELGANVNANPYRGTPLLWAIYSDRVQAAAWLLDHGADADLRHDFGGAEHGASAVAMHLAAQFNCLKCLRLLLDRGADPTICDARFGATPLGWAERVGAHEAAAMLRSGEKRPAP
jgi:ankyrin repeat protein